MLKNLKRSYNKINDRLGDNLAKWLSTMECFYIITMLVIIPLFFQQPSGIGWVQYIVTVFFQGVALPVLGYVSWKSGEKTEKMIKETHDAVMEELKLIKEELEMAKEDRNAINDILKDIKKITGDYD